jgi:accessory gene regulator B
MVDTVRFGLELILGEAIKWAVMIISAVLIGALQEVLFAMVSMMLFRLVSGGNHCEDYWRCLTFSLLVFLGAGKIGVYAAPYISYTAILISVVAGFLIMAVLVLVWAPGEVVYRKIKAEERAFFKALSLMFLVAWSGVTMFFIAQYSLSVAVAGLLAMAMQSFSFTPPGYWMIDRFDINMSRILGERRYLANAQSD